MDVVTAEDEFTKLKERLDSVVEHNGGRDAVLAVLDLISKKKDAMTLAVLKKTRLGVPVGHLTKDADPDVAEQARAIVRAWKKLVPAAASPSKAATKRPSTVPAEPKDDKDDKDEEDPPAKRAKRESTGTPEAPAQTPAPAAPAPATPVKTPAREHVRAEPVHEGKVDPVRERMRGLLERALAKEKEKEKEGEAFCYTPHEAARGLECAVYDLHDHTTGEDYGNHMRMLFLNLDSASRSDLRRAVLDTEDIRRWASMSSEQLMSDKQRTQLQKNEEDLLRTLKGVDPLANVTEGVNQCSRCGSRRIATYQMQTRGADEPMTVFYTCADCKKRWRS